MYKNDLCTLSTGSTERLAVYWVFNGVTPLKQVWLRLFLFECFPQKLWSKDQIYCGYVSRSVYAFFHQSLTQNVFTYPFKLDHLFAYNLINNKSLNQLTCLKFPVLVVSLIIVRWLHSGVHVSLILPVELLQLCWKRQCPIENEYMITNDYFMYDVNG